MEKDYEAINKALVDNKPLSPGDSSPIVLWRFSKDCSIDGISITQKPDI